LEIILVRHGDTEVTKAGVYCGWQDVRLNERGIRQAERIAEKLKDDAIDRIYCSPLLRTVETAEIINRTLGSTIQLVNDFKEINFGKWDGMHYKAVEREYPLLWKEWCSNWTTFRFPDGECTAEFHTRTIQAVERVMRESSGMKILIVTHQGCIRTIISHFMGTGLNGCWRYKISTGGICRMEIEDNYGVLTALNQ